MSNEMAIHVFIKIRLVSFFCQRFEQFCFLYFKVYATSLSHKNDVYYD